jgi:two-component system heavy metal sensor histidine kinase CusS
VSVRRLSIFATLVFWFTAIGFLILGGMTFFLFRTFERSQSREAATALRARVQDVVTTLEQSDDEPSAEEFAQIRGSIERENAIRPHSRFSVIVREGGRELLRAGEVPTGTGEQNYLTMTGSARQGAHHYIIYATFDQTAVRESLGDFRTNAYLGLLGAAALLALAGALVARHAMRPLARITAVTQKLDVGRLGQRVEDAAWPAELRALAAEFDRMQERLRQSFARLAQFSDDLAHELRTPVSNLMGAAEVAIAQPRSGDEYRETLASMLEETQGMRRMIDELLFLARAEQPERWLARTTLDARSEASAVIEFYAALADEKRIALTLEGAGEVYADRTLLRRALSNLLANALQYTPPGGNVRIVIDGSSIAVHDDGPGIEARHLPHIFDRFYRVDEARTRNLEGTGLGLAIVKSIVALHGGEAEVKSEPGHGSVFTLRFPKMTKL